jgi:hypothetical protein
MLGSITADIKAPQNVTYLMIIFVKMLRRLVWEDMQLAVRSVEDFTEELKLNVRSGNVLVNSEMPGRMDENI